MLVPQHGEMTPHQFEDGFTLFSVLLDVLHLAISRYMQFSLSLRSQCQHHHFRTFVDICEERDSIFSVSLDIMMMKTRDARFRSRHRHAAGFDLPVGRLPMVWLLLTYQHGIAAFWCAFAPISTFYASFSIYAHTSKIAKDFGCAAHLRDSASLLYYRRCIRRYWVFSSLSSIEYFRFQYFRWCATSDYYRASLQDTRV